MMKDMDSAQEASSDQQQQQRPQTPPGETAGTSSRDDETAATPVINRNGGHVIEEFSEGYQPPASDISDDEWGDFDVSFEPDATEVDAARIRRLARGISVPMETLKDRVEKANEKARVFGDEDDGDHENDSISYSSEETASDWSLLDEPHEPMDAVIEAFKQQHQGNEPSDHFALVIPGQCWFGHNDPKVRDCPCARPGQGPYRQKCLACVMSVFEEIQETPVSIPVPYAHGEDAQWAQVAFKLWRRAVASLLPAGEMRAITGIRRPRPRAPRPQRRFGPLKALSDHRSKNSILADAKGNRYVANKIGLELGIKPCNEGIPWLSPQEQWNLSCPNSLDPNYDGEIRRCREIGCQDPVSDPMDEQWLAEARTVNAVSPPPGYQLVRTEEQCDSSVEAKVAKMDARLYAQRPCTPNGYRYVCAEHWEDTHRFHQVQDLFQLHRVAPCPQHVKAVLKQYPEGHNSCACEEPLGRWQCRSCFEHKIRSQKRHFQRRVASPWTGFLPYWPGGVGNIYHHEQLAITKQLLLALHPCLHSIDGPDPAKQYLCGKERSPNESTVLDCRSCGGLIVLPPRLRAPVFGQANQEDGTETSWSQPTVGSLPSLHSGASRNSVSPQEEEQASQASKFEMSVLQSNEAASPQQEELEQSPQAWNLLQAQPHTQGEGTEWPESEVSLPGWGLASEPPTLTTQAEVVTSPSDESKIQQSADAQDFPQAHQSHPQEDVRSSESETPLLNWGQAPEVPTLIMKTEVMASPLREPERQVLARPQGSPQAQQSPQQDDVQSSEPGLSLPAGRRMNELRSTPPPRRNLANKRPRARRTPAASSDRVLRNRTLGNDQFLELGDNGKTAVTQCLKRKRN